MKKAVKIVGGIIGLLIVAVMIIPFVVDVDKFRPDIVKAANEKMNGTVELGKLSLSLWGRIHVSIDGLKVFDQNKNQVVSVKDASFDSSYLSILSGSPLFTVSMKEPDIMVIKGKDGKLNVMTLMKQEAVDVAHPNNASTADTKSSAKLPSIVVHSHTGISITDAKLVYKDQVMNLSNTIDKLNVLVKDFSLTRQTELEVWADLKTTMGTDLSVNGPLKLTVHLTPLVSGNVVNGATVDAVFSADDLDVQKGELFHKKKGIPANFKIQASLDHDVLKLSDAQAKFHNAEIDVKGVFSQAGDSDIHFEAKPVDLKPWSELIPMLKEYALEGALGLTGNVKGKPEALNYDAKLLIQNFSANGPHLKAKPIINGSVDVTTDKIEKFVIDLKGPGNDIALSGKLISFAKPAITFDIRSPGGMDLDQWIEFPKPEETKGKTSTAATTSGQGASDKAPQANYDQMMDPLRKNEMARAMTIDGNISIAFIKAEGTKIEDIGAKIQLKNLVAGITSMKLKMFEGVMNGGFTVDLKPAAPAYSMNLSLSGLNLSKAVENNFKTFKDTLSGKLSFSAQGGGSSFNTVTAKQKLQMKGDFKLLDAQFKTIDVSKMTNEAINGSVGKIADKVPFLKGKNIHVNQNGESKYESITGHFTINNGILDAPDFFAKAAPQKGIDIKGVTKMGLIDESLDAKWELTDTQRVTGADQLSASVAGKEIKNFLAKSEKDPVILPITVGCKWSSPCTNYSATAEYLAGVASGRLSHVAQDVVKQKATDAVKNALPSGIKKLFGH